MLERADVLVALWDGRAAQRRGGTGGMVAEARRYDLPIAWIPADNSEPGTTEPTTLGTSKLRRGDFRALPRTSRAHIP